MLLASAIVGPYEEASEPEDEDEGGGQARRYIKRSGGDGYYRDSAERLRITGKRLLIITGTQ